MVTAATPERILLGEGAVFLNYGETDEIAAGVVGEDGGTFSREVNLREIPYLGSRGPTKGMRRKTNAVPQFTFNALEIVNAETLTKFFAGLSVDNTGVDYDVITANDDIADTDYLKNVAFVGQTQSGKEVVIIVKNALGDGNLEMSLENENEVVPEVQYTGHYDPADPKAEPFEIRYPKVV